MAKINVLRPHDSLYRYLTMWQSVQTNSGTTSGQPASVYIRKFFVGNARSDIFLWQRWRALDPSTAGWTATPTPSLFFFFFGKKQSNLLWRTPSHPACTIKCRKATHRPGSSSLHIFSFFFFLITQFPQVISSLSCNSGNKLYFNSSSFFKYNFVPFCA